MHHPYALDRIDIGHVELVDRAGEFRSDGRKREVCGRGDEIAAVESAGSVPFAASTEAAVFDQTPGVPPFVTTQPLAKPR